MVELSRGIIFHVPLGSKPVVVVSGVDLSPRYLSFFDSKIYFVGNQESTITALTGSTLESVHPGISNVSNLVIAHGNAPSGSTSSHASITLQVATSAAPTMGVVRMPCALRLPLIATTSPLRLF
jgi:hypothetical protein